MTIQQRLNTRKRPAHNYVPNFILTRYHQTRDSHIFDRILPGLGCTRSGSTINRCCSTDPRMGVFEPLNETGMIYASSDPEQTVEEDQTLNLFLSMLMGLHHYHDSTVAALNALRLRRWEIQPRLTLRNANVVDSAIPFRATRIGPSWNARSSFFQYNSWIEAHLHRFRLRLDGVFELAANLNNAEWELDLTPNHTLRIPGQSYAYLNGSSILGARLAFNQSCRHGEPSAFFVSAEEDVVAAYVAALQTFLKENDPSRIPPNRIFGPSAPSRPSASRRQSLGNSSWDGETLERHMEVSDTQTTATSQESDCQDG